MLLNFFRQSLGGEGRITSSLRSVVLPALPLSKSNEVRPSVQRFWFSASFAKASFAHLPKNKNPRIAGTHLLYLRRGRDSNPRYGFPYTNFPGLLLQPLGHLSFLEAQR